MFSTYQQIVYTVIIYLCLFLSFFYRNRNGIDLFVYFTIVCTIEILPIILGKEWSGRIYSVASLMYIGFFTYYYGKFMRNQKKLIYVLGLISGLVCFYFMLGSSKNFAVGLGVTLALFYIFLSLSWLFDEVRNVDEDFIAKKQVFWVSSAILLWSVFFLFRIVPMYWLEKNDLAFLIMLDKIFRIAVTVTYIIFIIAITCKK